MALSIGVSIGSRITVGDSLVKVVDISQGVITLTVNKGPAFVINDRESTEILPEVFVFVGDRLTGPVVGARLAFEAPRSILINRVPHAVA